MILPRIARLLLWLGGWTMVGEAPTIHKAVVIAAPHTSNWDAFWGLAYKVAIGIDIKFFAKHTVFWFPLGTLLRGLGGIPLNRGLPSTAVQQAIEAFNGSERFYFGLAPEGTRSKTAGWKTGFYRIAEGAGVPVGLGFFDYKRKRIGIGPLLTLTGNPDADLDICRQYYAGIQGRWPEKTSPIVFPPGMSS